MLQDTLRRVDKAFKAFFRRVKTGQTSGYPRFQGKDHYDSFCYPQGGFSIEKPGKEKHKVVLSKIGHVTIKLHRPIVGHIKTCTVKREGDKWFACFSCEVQVCPQTPYIDLLVGVDMGVSKLATLSTGDVIANPKHYLCAEQGLVNMSRSVARKRRGSTRRKKAIKRLSKAHRKVTNVLLHLEHRIFIRKGQNVLFSMDTLIACADP